MAMPKAIAAFMLRSKSISSELIFLLVVVFIFDCAG
jgi:hypothetical protein